ncbi:N-6 DNA methylase [Phototrophicus methaneseepsis]|uniref:N-6 DNA methylase n=1 Tax=Phototrophicus methaneseepsis TaxID=2710758 RepID=A0A7S8EDD2_9CHLR|nr:N-6 DNA methylase [Phototrophicus methaneseepsis]QPC84866.1 N-6 DNA methylase [Phototrophicus methaneseepsis]
MSKLVTARQIRFAFGSQSEPAQAAIPGLYAALSDPSLPHPAASSDVDWAQIGSQYHIPNAEPGRLFNSLHLYIASVALWLAAEAIHQRTGTSWQWMDVCNGNLFRQHGLLNVAPPQWMQPALSAIDITTYPEMDLQAPQGDLLKGLYHELVPRPVRHAQGAYYTPDWLVQHVLEQVGYDGTTTLLDPACGSGSFLAAAIQRAIQMGHADDILARIAGIDNSEIAVLTAKTALILSLPTWPPETNLPIYHADTLFNDLNLPTFDFVVGNPPWVNWQHLSTQYREQTRPLWVSYGLFSHTGMDSILGKGKKDLATLFTCVVADRYLADGGTLAFLLSRSTLKSGGAGAGFRSYLAEHGPLTVTHIDDVSRLTTYGGSKLDTIVLYANKSLSHQPMIDAMASYTLWHVSGRRRQFEDSRLSTILKATTRHPMHAQPIDTSDTGSPWISAPQQALSGLHKLLGPSDYEAHAGVYTGGANGVYWLEVLAHHGETLTIRNQADTGKKSIKQVQATIESALVYPLLRGSDVTRWQAYPTTTILMVQDPQTRRGYDEDWLQAHYPLTYAYLAQFKETLIKRAAYQRYFKQSAPFYTMFDVGHYTFAPYKVVWQGIGAQSMQAAVVGPNEGHPVMTNQAMHPFVGLDNEDEAHYLAACLNSLPFNFALVTHSQAGGKSFAQAGILKRLRIPQYDPTNSLHSQLANFSLLAHNGTITSDLDHLSATLWHILPQEMDTMRQNIRIWQR